MGGTKTPFSTPPGHPARVAKQEFRPGLQWQTPGIYVSDVTQKEVTGGGRRGCKGEGLTGK